MKQHIQEALSNLDNMIEVDAVANPVTAQLKKDMKKKYDDFKEMTETDDNYLGAKKQPVPKKVEVPKIELSETLFEDNMGNIQQIKDCAHNYIFDLLESDVESNIALQVASECEQYDPEWCADIPAQTLDYARNRYISTLVNDLFANAPVNESLKEDLTGKDLNNLTNDVYNALSDIVYKYEVELELPIDHIDISGAVDHFIRNFFLDDDTDESLKEAFDINSTSRSKLIDAIDEFYREDVSNSFIIDNKTMDDILIENGANEDDSDPYEGLYSSMSTEQIKNVFQIVRDYLKTQDEDKYDSDIHRMFKLKRAWVDESLKEDYSEDELEQAINIVKKYYHNNLHSFLESFVFNCPIADGGEIIKDLADYIDEHDDYIDESLKESRQNNINDYIRELHRTHPAFTTADEMIEYLEDNDEIEELEDSFMTDVIGAIEEYFEDLDESLKKSKIQHNINEKREKVIQTPEERAEEGDLWTTVYNELSGDASLIKPSLGSKHSLYGREASNPYTKYEEILPTDTGMRIYGSSEEDFDFAKQVADDYDLYYWVDENENNFDDDPNRQYYIDIDIEQ